MGPFLLGSFLPDAFLPDAFLQEALLPRAFLLGAFLPGAFLLASLFVVWARRNRVLQNWAKLAYVIFARSLKLKYQICSVLFLIKSRRNSMVRHFFEKQKEGSYFFCLIFIGATNF